MDDMLSKNEDVLETAKLLAGLLQEHNGQDVTLLDIRGINDWADFFIIATISSRTHMDGLERHIKDFCHEKGIDIFGVSPKSVDDEWRLIDLNPIIVHLMNGRARDFYELEKLWRNNAENGSQPSGIMPPHSSKSSKSSSSSSSKSSSSSSSS